jgi:hypothetical protein
MPLEFSIQLNQIFAKIKNLLTKRVSKAILDCLQQIFDRFSGQ